MSRTKATVSQTIAAAIPDRFYDPRSDPLGRRGPQDLEPERLRRRIGAVFQDFACYELSASDNVGLGDLETGRTQNSRHSSIQLLATTVGTPAPEAARQMP